MNESIKQVRSNIPKIYLYSFFQCFLVLMPVIVPFWQSLNLSLKEIFLLQGIFGAALIVFDAPAGYLADLFGRKRSLIIGSVITALGYQIFWFGDSFWDFVVFELITGLGVSLQSGSDVAILYGSLDKLNLQVRKASYLGKRAMAMTTGEGFAALLGGFLAAFSLHWPAYVNAVCAWIPALVCFTLYEPSTTYLQRNSHIENFREIGRVLFGQSKVLTLAIANFIFYGFATYCAVWILQPDWQARGISISLFGYLWAANNFLVALISRYAHSIEERIGSVAVVWAIAILPVIGYLGLSFTPGLIGLLFALAFPICRGLNGVIFQDAINTRVPADMRATTNSVGSLGMRALFLVFGPLLGHLLDTRGTAFALQWLGWIYLAGIFLIALPLLRQRNDFRMD